MAVTRKITFMLRRGTAAEWAAAGDPVLAEGEPGVLVDPSGPETLKIGDGVTAFSALQGSSGSGGSGGGGAVDSVNGATGAVVLDAADVGAAPALGADDNYVTDAEKVKLTNLSGTNTGDSSSSMRAAGPFRKAVAAGTARIVFMGDSKTEGAGVASIDQRWQNVVVSKLRAMFAPAGDAGAGYIPGYYAVIFYGLAESPVLSGGATVMGTDGGLGKRAVILAESGHKATWTSQSCNRIRVWYTQRPDLYGSGSFETFVDGVSQGVTSCAGPRSSGHYVEYALTAGPHVVDVRWASGWWARVEGVEFRTDSTGVMGYDAAHSGFTSRHFAVGVPEWVEPDSHLYHWQAVQAVAPHLIVCALGANDMSILTVAEWAANLEIIAARCEEYAPGSGLIFMVSAELQSDIGSSKLADFEAAARASLSLHPRATIVYESSVFQPVAGDDADPYNVWTDEPGGVHPSALGNAALADLVLSVLCAVPAGGGGGGAVSSVAGKTGDVALVAADVSDASTTGKALLTAPDAAAARSTVGAAAASHTHEATTARQVRTLVGRYYNGVDHVMTTNRAIPRSLACFPISFAETVTVDRIGMTITTAGSAANFARLGIYASGADGLPIGTPILNAGTIDTTTAGVKELTVSQVLTAGVVYWLCYTGTSAAGSGYGDVNTATQNSANMRLGRTSMAGTAISATMVYRSGNSDGVLPDATGSTWTFATDYARPFVRVGAVA